jgi:ABC-type enterochelin transport system permease subunit
MKIIPERFQVAVWFAAIVLAVALISHVLDQTHDLTLVMILVGGCVFAVDWLIAPRQGK